MSTARVFSKETGLPLAQLASEPSRLDYSLPKLKAKMSSSGLYMAIDTTGAKYEFSVTNEEFISVLSVLDSGDALALLNAGLRSPEEVAEFLRLEGLQSLQRDYSRLGTIALESGLSPLHFMEFMNATDASLKSNLHAIDAVRTFALEKKEKPDLWYHGSLAQSVVHGDARYEDIVTIGAALTRRHFDLEGLTARLSDLAWSATPLNFDAIHLRSVIERRMESGMDPDAAEALLTMMSHYGGDFALSLKNPVQVRRAMYSLPFSGDNRIIIKYADTIYSEAPDVEPTLSDIILLHTHGIEISVAVQGLLKGQNGQQIVAMINGVEAALNEGWL